MSQDVGLQSKRELYRLVLKRERGKNLSEGVLATAAKEQTNVQAKQCVLRTGRRQEYRVDREVIEATGTEIVITQCGTRH